MLTRINQSITYAVLAAGLFGISAPIAKLLLAQIAPVPLAGLVYLGSGILLLLARTILKSTGKANTKEAPVTKQDIPWLLGAIIAGGVAAPIVLMFGLKCTPAATASLLLNFEGVATALIAAIAFNEAIDRRVWTAIGLITLASAVLSIETTSGWGISVGVLGISAACLLWGIDNNTTRQISARDPLTIVIIKGIAAGSVSTLLAVATGSPFPPLHTALLAMGFGSISYGLSIVMFIFALRGLGAARTGAYFGTAPFIGAAVSFLIFRNIPDIRFLISMPLMVIGAFFLMSEKHEHLHEHNSICHEHRHVHQDGHHNHLHDGVEGQPNEPHSHLHKHERIYHQHQHTPDDHHRHSH
ncbi:MAG: EamA family transporter [Armatimonadota bacterium]